MVRCPAAVVGHGMWPLRLVFFDLGGVCERLFAGMIGGIFHDRTLLEGYRLDCYCCGVPVYVLVFLAGVCERVSVGAVCGRCWVDESLLVLVQHLVFHHDGLDPHVVIFSLGCFMHGCLSPVVCVGLRRVRFFGLNRDCVIKEAV